MIFVIIICILYAADMIFDFIPKYVSRSKSANAFYIVILILTFTIDILYGVGVQILSPAKLIQMFIQTVFHLK